MREISKKLKIYLTDAYYMIFRYPSYTELRLQKMQKDGTEAENTRLDQHYRSYSALKKRHKKLKIFFISLIPVSMLIVFVALVVIAFILNILFTMLRIENNPFHLSTMFNMVMNYLK